MSKKNQSRKEVLEDVLDKIKSKKITPHEALEMLGISEEDFRKHTKFKDGRTIGGEFFFYELIFYVNFIDDGEEKHPKPNGGIIHPGVLFLRQESQ